MLLASMKIPVEISNFVKIVGFFILELVVLIFISNL